jgi:hypothetical protein
MAQRATQNTQACAPADEQAILLEVAYLPSESLPHSADTQAAIATPPATSRAHGGKSSSAATVRWQNVKPAALSSCAGTASSPCGVGARVDASCPCQPVRAT